MRSSPQPPSWGALFPLHMCGYLTPLPSLFMRENAATLHVCVLTEGGREGEIEREPGNEQADSLRTAWFACPVKGRWCRAVAEVSASAPVKLRLSFTTGCSRPSFQTAIHPLLLCPSLPSHSLALRYGPWHQAGLFAITQLGDSRGPAANSLAVLWCDI